MINVIKLEFEFLTILIINGSKAKYNVKLRRFVNTHSTHLTTFMKYPELKFDFMYHEKTDCKSA